MKALAALTEIGGALAAPEYGRMLARIFDRLPAIAADSAGFHKSHSQFMSVMLDATALTPIRTIKGVLAEIQRARQALEESYIVRRRHAVDIREKRERIASASDEFARERLQIDIEEIEIKARNHEDAISGAVRKLVFFVGQHEALMARLGKTELTEADYEADEARYHIITAMFQALCAARARGGIIDEGNHIYLFQLGIPGAIAQAEVTALLKREQDLLAEGKALAQSGILDWLEGLALAWKDFPKQMAERRGVSLLDEGALHGGVP